MPPAPVHTVTLACHPETPTDAVRGIAARVSRTPGGRLAVTYILDGDLGRLRVPAPRASRIGSRLWQHTCCEIFVAARGSPGYHEFNLSPSGEWAEYAFDSYRTPQVTASRAASPDPQVAVRTSAGKLELDAVIRLPTTHSGRELSLALSAVIEDRQGSLSYWALRHPPGGPDFHHSDAFALELAKVGG